MTRFKTIGSLQLHEDLAHERREWKLQRVGWALMALALLAAVLGLFGHGPLSETASASADGALTVRHQRFERYQAPSEYDIGALPALAAGGVLVRTSILAASLYFTLKVKHRLAGLTTAPIS